MAYCPFSWFPYWAAVPPRWVSWKASRNRPYTWQGCSSGALSDWLGRRKGLVLIGYGMAALTKPFFPLAGSYAVVFAARLMDRVGKGVRGAPRDALVADLVPKELRGASYGLRQSLDTIGALSGPSSRHSPDARKRRRYPSRVLDRGPAGFCLRRSARPSCARAVQAVGAERNPHAPPLARSLSFLLGLLVGRRHRDGSHIGSLQRGIPFATSE